MAHPRNRNDVCRAVYRVANSLIGEPGELLLGEREMRKLSLLIRQADRLFCVDVISFTVTPRGYSLVCSAPSDMPTLEEVWDHFTARYGRRREAPDFNDSRVYERWAMRLRNFSALMKDIQQRFTQWFNRVVRGGLRRGTVWKSRFESQILETADQVLESVRSSVDPGKRGRGLRKLRGQRWRKTKRGYAFLRDTGIPALSTGAGWLAAVTWVVMDEMSRFPGVAILPALVSEVLDAGLRSRWLVDPR